MVTATALVCASVPAQAQKGPPVIRDAETEQLLREYTQPILRSAGLAQQNVQVVIINDRSFNAFVADGRRIFVNGGALMESETPNQIIGVLAHETGHIAGGHLSRLREAVAAATTQSIIAMILGVGAMVAAGRGGGSGMGQAGAAAIAGPTSAIQNSMFSYMRAQEDQADRAAVKFLTATGQSAKGMHETFKRLADQTLYQTRYMNPYMQSHPMPSERVAALEGMAKASPYWDHKDPPALQLRHDLMRAKLYGFLERPEAVARRYPPGDTSLPARYARAIAAYRFSEARGALAQIDALIQAQPQNPYFYELKGQALLEAGRPTEAVAPLRHAVQLAPNPALIQIMLGQALVATRDRGRLDEAVSILQAAVNREPESPDAYSQLAMAYGQKNDLARADLGIRAGGLRARRHEDRARDCYAGQDPFPGRLSRLGEGRRPRQLQAAAERVAPLIREGRTTMNLASRPLAAALFAVVLALPAAAPARAQSFNADQRGEIEKIIKDYLLSHPELMQDVMNELDKKQAIAEAEKHRTTVTENSAAIFSSPRQVNLGNPQGDVTVVEFFDYNCSYCKRAMSDMVELMKNDGKLKFVLKEFPVLGEGSVQAAQVAAAVRMQDKTGKKYLEFHQKLLGGRGQADKTRALAVAKEIGLDVARIEKDMAGDEVKATIEENFKLAEALGLNGTPSYVVGTDVVIGAVGANTLKEKINSARCGKATC